MSLVDASYGSDDDDDVVEVQAEAEKEEEDGEVSASTRPAAVGSEDALNSTALAPSVVPPSQSSMIDRQSRRGGGGVLSQSVSSPTDSGPRIRLPDVSDLLGPSASDSQRKSDTQKKRPAVNGSAHSLPRFKLPRGILQPARVAPDTAGGLLTPPQLRGRSNVATEDLDKIFSRRQRR